MPPDPRLPRKYDLELFAETDLVQEDDVLRFWQREAGMSEADGRARLSELLFVVTVAGELVAVSTTYTEWNARLGMDLWHLRALVAERHRADGVATILSIRANEYMEPRYLAGVDTRAAGFLLEVENEVIKRVMDLAVWGPPDCTFVGENERGDHLRVHYFPGAPAPGAPPGRRPA